MLSRVIVSSTVPMAKMPPSFSMMMVSAYFAARLRSWQIIMTSIPLSSDSLFSMWVTSSWCLTSRLAVGSSSSRISVCWARPRASMTFWCCPAERLLKGCMARSSMPTSLSTSYTMRTSSRVLFQLLCGWRPSRTASATLIGNESGVMHGT